MCAKPCPAGQAVRKLYKAVWYIMLVALAGLLLTACWPAEEVPLCGGVVDRSDHSAPKAILSKEIRAFSTTFWRYDEDSPQHEVRRWHITIRWEDTGELWMEINGDKAKLQGDTALLAEVQDVIDRFGLVMHNGVDRVTSGLPPAYAPTWLKAEYASGERLYFQTNGDPDSPWTAAILEIFLPEKRLDKKASGQNAH